MNLLDQIRQSNPDLQNASDDEIKSSIRNAPEFTTFSDQQFERFVTGNYGGSGTNPAKPGAEEEGSPGFTGGVASGIDQIQAMGGGLMMAAGDALKSDTLWEGGRETYQRNMQEAQESSLDYGFTDIRGAGDAFNWARYTAGNLLPTLAVSVAGGGIGGLAGRMLAGQAAKQAAMKAGQALGTYAASSGMETGAIMGETEDLDVSLAHGSVAGALDFLAPFQILRKAGGKELADKAVGEISEGVMRDLQRTAGRSTKGAFGRGSLTTTLTEAPTEGLQGLIGQHANYWVENNGESLLNNLGEVNYKAFVDEMAAGGLMGPAVGGPTGLIERAQAKSQLQKIENARQQAEQSGGDALDQAQAAQQAEQEAMDLTPQPGEMPGNFEASLVNPGTEGAQEPSFASDLEALNNQPAQPYGFTELEAQQMYEAEQAERAKPLSERAGTEQDSSVVYQQDGVTITRDNEQAFTATDEQTGLQAFGRDAGEARRRLVQLSERNQPQAPVLQNRDRSDPGYIQQMEAIANNPDYDQVSASKTPDAGAPMVFPQGQAPQVDEADTGRQETITMADGQGGTRKIRAQYAVVEAGNLKASHRADGSQNTDYGRDGLIALNNGRTAGLQEAYNRGTADTYRQNLREDAQTLGIDPAAIDSKEQPVLVRLFDGSQLEGIDDPGAASNERLSADLSPSEQAQTDARRITPDVLATLQAGDPTGADNADFVRSALSAIAGDNRKTDLRDRNGLLTAAGQKRIRSALVERAYSDQTLTQELTEATDNDLKTLGDALTESAGRWALMRERAREGSINQDMDITDTLVSAVNMIRKSRQEGRSLKDIADQVDAFAGEADQMAVHMLHLFYHGSNYNRIRAKDTIAGALQGYVESALQTSPAPDMFGQMASPQDALEAQRGQTEGTQPQATAPRVQPDGTDNREAGQAGERPGRDQVRAQDAEASRDREEVRPGITENGQQVIKKNGQAFANTRGLGYYFHGTSAPISSLSDEVWTSLNIYGQGLYTTEAVDIADGYMKKGRGEDPALYRASIPENLPLYDLDQPMTAEVASMAEEILDDLYPGDLESGSLGEVMDEARVDSSAQMIPADEVQGMFDSIRYNLEQMGYHGYTHVGGRKTNNPNHQVRIYWTPSQDGVSLQREDLQKYRDANAADFNPGPDLELTTQTEQDLAEQEQQRQQSEQEEARRQREAEQRAQADAEADDFVLSGSDSAIDQAEARGQGNMFDQPAAKAQQEGSAQRPAEAATGASSLTWKKDSNRKIWRSNDGQIITDESFGVGGNRIKFFPVYANDAERGAGNNYTSGESLAEAKSKAAPQQEPAQPEIPEASPKQGTAPSQPIEDFGEKIEGARKDYASKLQDAKAKDTAAVPLSESWPEPDYQKLLDSGADPEAVGFAHAARDEVPPKPRKGWKLKGWTRQVEALRNFTESVIEGEFNVDDMREFARKDGYRALEQHVFNRADLYAAVGHEKSLKGLRFFSAHYSMFDGEKGSFDKWVIERTAKTGAFGNMPRRLVAADSRQEAIDKFREVHESLGQKEKAGKNVRFDIYSSRRDSKDIFIGKKIGGDVVRIQEGFTSLKEARAYLQDNQAELEDWLAKMKQIPNHRKESNAPRVGKDHRNGGDVTPDAFAETFGFRGVQFGNYVEQGRRQQDLNDAYDGLMDLAGILNVPARALSLNGELGLAFGARGKGGKSAPKAHYERHNIVINLTKKDGAGSLAHEWFHSLDNYFSRERGGNAENAMATEGNAASSVRPEVAEAFRNVRRAVNRTKLKQRSEKLDKVRTKAYWSTDPEMTARAFESYVIEKLRDQGASNDYLANIVSEEYWEASEALGMQDSDSYPYPEAAEIPEIRSAYDNLFEVIDTREDESGNVAMFSRAAQTDTEAFREWFGDSKVVDESGQPLIVYHGTRQEFDVFDMSRTGENTPYTEEGLSGAHFHSDYEDAEFYTEPEDLDGNQREGDSPRVIEAYLSLQSPLTVDVEKNETNYFDQNTSRLLDAMEDGEHDGIIVNGKDGSLYFVPAAEQIKFATGNTGAFDPTNPDIRYSQPDRTGYRRTPNTRVQAMSAPEARRIANVLMKKWKGRPPMIVAEEIAEFPLELQAAIYQAGAQNDMRAVFWDNKVFVLAPRIPNRRALEEVILHETIGHYGLRKMMGDNLKMLLERVYRDLGDSRQAEQLKQTYFGGNFNARNQEHRLTIAEELIAHLAESGKHQYRTLLERILTVVRNSLRRMGFTIEITERDLLALLDGADKVVRNGGISVPSSADIHFSRADYENARNGVDSGVENNDAPPLPDVEEITDDSETQRILDRYEQRKSQSEVRRTTVGGGQARADWHRETKIRVSEEQPDVFFRGAAQQLTPEDFSAARRGYNTRHPSAALGTFFTNSDQDAARYGSVYPYNLDLRNPFVVKGEDLPPFNDPAEAEQYRADIEAEGYDGILIDYTDLGGPQHIVPFEPESVLPINETPMFSRVGNRLESAEDHFEDLTAAQRTALGKIAPRTPSEKATEWLSERLDRWATKLRQGIVDRFAALKELDENLYGRDVVESSTASSSWVLAQMSGAASGALQTMLTAGRLKFNQEQKVIGIRDGGAQGLNDVLKKLGSAAEIERFFGWIAGNRSKRLLAEGRENLFEPDEVEALATLNRGRTEGGKSRAALYREVFKEFQQYRDDVLEIAEQTGTITAEQRQTWANEFYVPFYRLADNEGGFTGPKASGGISRQEAYKRLKGGSQNLNDLLENTMMNFHHLLQTSLKNQAALQAMDNAQELGIAREVREADRNTENSTFVLRDGQKIWYEIDDPLVFKAVTALAHPGMNSAAMKVMRGFKRLFTNMTTTTPQFVVANLLRDSMQASATSEVSKNFMRNIAEGTKAYGDRRTRARMMASGGSFSFGHLYGENADEMRLQLTGELSRADILRQPSMVPNAMRLMWRKWNDMTDFTENVNRAAIFEQNVESRGELYAAFKARDLMNFSQHGAWPAVRILIDIVPFLNARLQGLDKIYRSGVKPGILSAMGKGTVSDKQAAQRFWTVTGAITMATIALYLNNEDDEEYAKLEDWQKDTYWFFRVSEDHAIFIPKPFEVGAIATLAERITEQAVSDTATGELFKERLMHMVMDTFSFSPVPQAFQPALDVYANYDAFTGRPIENMGMQRLSPELRRRNSTTMPADVGSAISRGLSSVWGGEGLSPIQVDHLIQGYFGAVGSWGAGIADTIWRTANGETSPDRRWYEFQPVRRFYSNLGDEDRYTRYGTLFYESLKETRRVYADIKEYQELGQMAEARKLAQENATSLRYRTTLNRMQRKLSKLNKSMQQIQRMDASSEYKRRELDRIRAIKNRMLETIGQRLERINADE